MPIGRALLDIDRDTRAKLQAATEAALERALERAGNRLRAKGVQVRTTLARVPPRDCCATLGPRLVAAAGLDDDDLLAEAWTQLETDYYRLGSSAQKRAMFWASKVSGGMDAATRATYGLRQVADLDEGWAWMKENLTALAKARLYAPDPLDPGVGEFDPTSRVPTGLIRQAMRRAGGVKGSADLTKLTTTDVASGDVWITVPDGSAPGGIATGQLITDIVTAEGGSVSGYRWVYGPADRSRPFRPHMRLDGLVFASFTDDRLVCGGWPGTGHYIPGDHQGCICDVEPIVLTAEQVAALQAEGRLPKVVQGPQLGPAVPPPLGKPHGPARPGPEYGPTKAPPPLGDVHGPKRPAAGPAARLGVHRLGTRSYGEAMASVATRRTGAGRGFAFDGPDVEAMHVHVAPVRLQKSTSGALADATEYRFKLTDQGARAWREAVLPNGDTVNRRGWRGQYQETLETRKAEWKQAGWTVRKGVRIPDPGIAAQGDGLAQVNLGKATAVRNKGNTKLSWGKADDAQQLRWTGKFKGRNVTVEYADVAANDSTATTLHNEVRMWVEGTEAPSEDYWADLMERLQFTTRVGVPTDADALAYAERALINKLGTADSRMAVYGRSGGQVGYDPAKATSLRRAGALTPDEQDKAITEALADIRLRFGIGPEDVALATSADGRTVVQLTDKAVQRLVDETGVTFFKHSLHRDISHDPRLLVDMLTGDQGGLLSSRRRMADGLPFGGLSADRDFETGGADFVFTRQQNAPKWLGNRTAPGTVVVDNDRLRDLDWFSYRNDLFGQTHMGSHYGTKDFVEELREGAKVQGGGLYGQETMFKDTIDFGHVQALYLDGYTRDEVLRRLDALGVTHVGMAPIRDVVRLAGEATELDPVLVPGGPHAPRRFDPASPTAPPPPVSGLATPLDPYSVQVAKNGVQSVGPNTAIAMIENGAIKADATAAWVKPIQEALIDKYGLGQLDDWSALLTDYGWDIADNSSFGAKLIGQLATTLLGPDEAFFINTWKF